MMVVADVVGEVWQRTEWEAMRVWANDQMRGEEGTGPRKKWMKKRRWRADLLIRRSHSQRNFFLKWVAKGLLVHRNVDGVLVLLGFRRCDRLRIWSCTITALVE